MYDKLHERMITHAFGHLTVSSLQRSLVNIHPSPGKKSDLNKVSVAMSVSVDE